VGLRQLHRGQVHRLSAGCATRTHHRRRDGSQSSALPESVLREAKRVGVRTARLVAILSVLMAIAAPAKADDFASLVGRLAGDSFADKEKAVTALGAQEDPRAVSLLRALTAGHLLRAPDGRVVVSETAGGTTRLRDAVTGEDITGTDPDSLDRIIVNNRLRGDIGPRSVRSTSFQHGSCRTPRRRPGADWRDFGSYRPRRAQSNAGRFA